MLFKKVESDKAILLDIRFKRIWALSALMFKVFKRIKVCKDIRKFDVVGKSKLLHLKR